MKSTIINAFLVIILSCDENFADYNDSVTQYEVTTTTSMFVTDSSSNEIYNSEFHVEDDLISEAISKPESNSNETYDNYNLTFPIESESIESLISPEVPSSITFPLVIKNVSDILEDVKLSTTTFQSIMRADTAGSTLTAASTSTPIALSSTLEPSSSTTVTTIIVKSVEDYHKYYKSEIIKSGMGSQYWISEDIMYKADKHHTLSESHRSAATISLSFPFTFYGHEVNQVTIATGGFLYMSEFLHQWLTATQYIAPLMANFDTQIGNNSFIRHWDNGSIFVVWWEDVFLQDEVDGHFSFQVQLYKNGTIVFSYKDVPTVVSGVPSHRHPVKIGMSDAYYMDKPTNTEMKQRTIYEYHRVEINMSLITSNTSVVISPLPSCIQMKSCSECVSASKKMDQTCQWCPTLQHCSDGLDRKRQEWMHNGCHKDFLSTEEQCSQYVAWTYSSSRLLTSNIIIMIIVVLIFFMMMMLVLAWLTYAYRHPSSRSGIWLIEHQPSQIRQRVVNFFTRLRTSLNASKYRVAMQPEVESLAQM
ncbi:hypothetical protein HELRODRAFT_109381 [Helobdella robusta]|uniref:PSI domain-containing protein n=1 Tax=Helobdella robusta TaxID=6412 RepID=T1EET0_HELRO|nr:hypothetical protein HELRODRAFT_109381 [Helobdella robusta]ESO09996.1 hypothetical protein HELRODRAFT_109381 [Helobdella robusta]